MFATFLSAILFYLSFPNLLSVHGYWPCIWFFAVPLLIALHDQPLQKRLALAGCWGLLAYGLIAQGIISISPAAFFAMAIAGTIQTVLFVLIYRPVKNPWINAVYAAGAWACSEWIRNIMLGGFSFYASHAQAFCPAMLRFYGVIGSVGMSAVIVLANGFIAGGIRLRRWPLTIVAIVIFSIVAAGSLMKLAVSPVVHLLRIGVVQANISPHQKGNLNLFNEMVLRHLHLTDQAAQAHPDLIIWPETAFPDDLLQSTQWRGIIFGEARHLHTHLLIGMAPIIDGKEYNSALLIDPNAHIAGLYHKQLLVPFAETTLSVGGLQLGRGYHFSPGTQPGILTLSDHDYFGVMICSESAHPSLVRRMCHQGAVFLVDMSNDGWFKDNASYMLHAKDAVIAAVENRVWVIRAANTGFSFAVDPDGVIHTDGNLKLGHEGSGIFDIIVNHP